MPDWLDIVFGVLVGFVFIGMAVATMLRGAVRER